MVWAVQTCMQMGGRAGQSRYLKGKKRVVSGHRLG